MAATAKLVHVARALYYFPGDQLGDLLFEEGDVIDIYEMDDPNWWAGKSRRTGEYGSFPSTLVEVINIGPAGGGNNTGGVASGDGATAAAQPVTMTLPARPGGKGPSTVIQFVPGVRGSDQNGHDLSMAVEPPSMLHQQPPTFDSDSHGAGQQFEANIQEDLLQLMQEAALEAEGTSLRPLPQAPAASSGTASSSRPSRADRPLPNLPGTAIERELVESMMHKQQPAGHRLPAMSTVETICPDDSVSMVGRRFAFQPTLHMAAGGGVITTAATGIAMLPKVVEIPERGVNVVVSTPPRVNSIQLKRLSLPVTSRTTAYGTTHSQPVSPLGAGAAATGANAIASTHHAEYQKRNSVSVMQQPASMSMPVPQLMTQDSSSGSSSARANPKRPLPQPPPVRRDRNYIIPGAGEAVGVPAAAPPVLLPKPPKSVISSVIGLPRTNATPAPAAPLYPPPLTINGGVASAGIPSSPPGTGGGGFSPSYMQHIHQQYHQGPPTVHANGTIMSTGSFVLSPAEIARLNNPAEAAQPAGVYGLVPAASVVPSNVAPRPISGLPGALAYNGQENSIRMLAGCMNARDAGSDGIDFQAVNLAEVDNYVRNIQRVSPSTTPDVLAVKFLARPFRTDLQRVRAIFIWMVDHIVYVGPDSEKAKRGSRGVSADDPIPSVRPDLETAESTLRDRCSSRNGFALLFHKLAIAMGLHCGIVRGFLKATDDELNSDILPPANHAWNVVRIDGEYRFVDLALAAPTHPFNESSTDIQYHYFLTPPNELIYTHYPSDHTHQHLHPPVAPSLFRALPFVRGAYFDSDIDLFRFTHNRIELHEQESAQVAFGLADDARCFAEVELLGTQVRTRALTQCLHREGRRFARILVRMKGDDVRGFLKIYVGRQDFSVQNKLGTNTLPLAFSIRMHHHGRLDPLDFVQLFPTPHEFYIREPLDMELRSGQTYRFRVQAVSDHRNKKLSLRAPSTREHNFAYYPNEQNYVLSVTIRESGNWSLIYHTDKDGKATIAQYACKDGPKPKK